KTDVGSEKEAEALEKLDSLRDKLEKNETDRINARRNTEQVKLDFLNKITEQENKLLEDDFERKIADEKLRYKIELENTNNDDIELLMLEKVHLKNLRDIRAEHDKKALEARKAEHAKLLAAEFSFRQLMIDGMLNQQDKEIAQEQLRYDKQRQVFKDNNAALEEIERQHYLRLFDIAQKYRFKEINAQRKFEQEKLENAKTY